MGTESEKEYIYIHTHTHRYKLTLCYIPEIDSVNQLHFNFKKRNKLGLNVSTLIFFLSLPLTRLAIGKQFPHIWNVCVFDYGRVGRQWGDPSDTDSETTWSRKRVIHGSDETRWCHHLCEAGFCQHHLMWKQANRGEAGHTRCVKECKRKAAHLFRGSALTQAKWGCQSMSSSCGQLAPSLPSALWKTVWIHLNAFPVRDEETEVFIDKLLSLIGCRSLLRH